MLFGLDIIAGLWKVFDGIKWLIETLWRIIIPIPLLVILVIGTWWYFDRDSYAKHEVKAAIEKLVAGETIAGLQAEVNTEKVLNDRKNEIILQMAQRAADLAAANKQFETDITSQDDEAARLRKELANAQINQKPYDPTDPNGQCGYVTPDMYNRVYNGRSNQAK